MKGREIYKTFNFGILRATITVDCYVVFTHELKVLVPFFQSVFSEVCAYPYIMQSDCELNWFSDFKIPK